jgi:long-chain acyl-CoA synthetase
MNFNTIPEMFLELCKKYSDTKPAFYFKKDGIYTSINYKELLENVENFAFGILNLGLKAGDRIGLVSENRIEWIIADLAIASIGAVSVPIFSTLTSKQEEYIFNNCEASAIICSNNFQLFKLLEVKEEIPSLRHIIVMNKDFKEKDVTVKSMEYVSNRGEELKNTEQRKNMFEELIMQIKPADLLTIIYTSGTTGNPKGVMLTQNNIVSNVKAGVQTVDFNESDTLLSFLPWCHSYERTTGYYCFFSVGASIYIAESIETVGKNIMESRPTIMTTVPKLLESIKKKIYNGIDRESPIKQKIFHWAVKVGREYVRTKLEGKNPIGIQYMLADKIVFSKLREKTGGRIKKFVSGGAALSPDVCEFFLAAGLLVLEGYGLTEASPVVSISDPGNLEIGTIGKPVPGVEVKIAEDGEILVRGDNVMKGYWNDPQATREAIDEEGWLYTGDVGYITAKGNIKITDRKKYIFVSSGGKNIAPQPIENLLSESPYIEQCILIGDSREYCTALITPDFEQLRKLAENFGISFSIDNELISNEKIIKAIKNDIDRLQKDLAKYERVRKFSLLSQSFSIENGELTPKMSVRRHVVERKYSDLIEQMYGLD